MRRGREREREKDRAEREKEKRERGEGGNSKTTLRGEWCTEAYSKEINEKEKDA